MKDFEIVFERSEVKREDMEMQLDKAFDIIFSELEKAADLGSAKPQNPIRAGEVSVSA